MPDIETVQRAPVGAGIIDKMTELGDGPQWANEYQFWDFAMTLGQSGTLYIFDAATGRVLPFRPRGG